MKRRVHAGDWLLALVVLAPLVTALPGLVASLDGSWPAVGRVLGRLAGILALSTFLGAAMLSARLARLDRWLGGLVRIWGIHRLLGLSAFLLTMLHVLAVAFAVLPVSVERSVEVLFPSLAQWGIWAGWAGFAAMVVFIAPTFEFFGKLDYQRWKKLHAISALALLLAVIHGLSLTPAPILWWVLVALAAAAIVWRKALSPFLARRPYVVDGVDHLARDVVELRLRPAGAAMTWRPGQFVYLTPLDPSLEAGYREEHPYTISSSPSEAVMRIGIKASGDATEALMAITPGADVQIEGPYGTFLEIRDPDRKQLWFGGGIGITPFVAGIRDRVAGSGEDPDTVLFYLNNRPERAYYLEEMERVAARDEGLRVQPHYFSEEGVISRDYIVRHCPDFASREVFLCGPIGMVRHLQALLAREGVPRGRIHTEAFEFL